MSKKYALIVEDNPVTRELLTTVLGRMGGYAMLEAGDAEQAYRLLERYTPDMVILDYHLPGANGTDVLTYIRADPRLQAAAVVLLTADNLVGHEYATVMQTADLQLQKPVMPRDLLRMVQQLQAVKDAALS
ncbi:MAG: response regulator [Armatimonadetes bacterium]|nr:response regulator [Anaerolineae bacterium]